MPIPFSSTLDVIAAYHQGKYEELRQYGLLQQVRSVVVLTVYAHCPSSELPALLSAPQNLIMNLPHLTDQEKLNLIHIIAQGSITRSGHLDKLFVDNSKAYASYGYKCKEPSELYRKTTLHKITEIRTTVGALDKILRKGRRKFSNIHWLKVLILLYRPTEEWTIDEQSVLADTSMFRRPHGRKRGFRIPPSPRVLIYE